MARILVFTPTYGGLLQPETVESIEALDFDGDWVLSDENPYPGRDMRNVFAQFSRGWEMALAGGYDGLLCVEHDMVIPPDAPARLWGSEGQVVYGAYRFRHRSGALNLMRYENDRCVGQSLSLYPLELAQAQARGWVEVSGVGFGCTLVRRDVLEAVALRGDEGAPDLPFARECVARGIRQVGRLDVACGHVDRDAGMVWWPEGERMQQAVEVVQSVVTSAGRLVAGERVDLEPELAAELARAGYVRIVGRPGRETATAPGYETATAPAWLPDRLTVIKGIGARTAEALNAAGVHTFQQLADADPDALAAALDGSSPAQVRRWQADAIGFLG